MFIHLCKDELLLTLHKKSLYTTCFKNWNFDKEESPEFERGLAGDEASHLEEVERCRLCERFASIPITNSL